VVAPDLRGLSRPGPAPLHGDPGHDTVQPAHTSGTTGRPRAASSPTSIT
jgi:hypothetical protein